MPGARLPNGEYAPLPDVKYKYDLSLLDIGKVISNELGIPLRNGGFNPAPCCAHRDCFKVNVKGGGYYKCFSTGCSAKGTVLDFIVNFKGMSRSQAAQYLIKSYFKPSEKKEPKEVL